MLTGLTIRAVDPDEDYLGIEICASNERFAGSTRIYAGVDQLSEFASKMEAFPRSHEDHRTYEFGTLDSAFAGGFCSISLRCLDKAGHVGVALVLEDDAD